MISKKRVAIKFFVVVLSCVFVSGNAEVRCIEREREALLSFKNGLIDAFDKLSSWRSNECCEWDGVECSNTTGHVITLQCHDCGLRGEVRSSLLELHHLIDLDLSRNYFGGIPIPQFIGSMKQLRHLDLNSCKFSGTIPSHLGNLTKLRSLDLGGNDFGGIPIPEFIGSMKQLQLLNLGSSNFSGTIPPELGNLTNLLSLDLSSNSLSSISAFILRSVLESLEILDVSKNQLNGSLPDMRAFHSLTELHLPGNNFTGSIPLSIGQLSKLQVLDLSSNSLEGLVTESHFIKLDKLKKLDLSFNPSLILDIASDWIPPFQLSKLSLAVCNVGPYFPNWIRTQRDLAYLTLTGANITDEAPRWLWSTFSSLTGLYLSDNQISGPIPLLPAHAFLIQLSGNMFAGSMSSFCKTHGLLPILTLSLSNNQLAGEIPDCWEQMPSLFSLDLANNHFSGEIPRSLGALHDLQALLLHDKHYGYSSFLWKGQESKYWNNLRLLKLIDFSSNELTGNIPRSFSTMRGLVSLNLSRNSLTGYIIPDIGKMEMLNSLDLSHNQLSGHIPKSLTEIYTIGVLDLSNNHLSGKIPTGTQLQSFNASSYADNDGLCGDPLPKCPGDRLWPSTTNPDENMNEKDGSNFSFMQEVGISMAFGFIFGFWGVIGSFTLKKSWRIAFFNLFDAAGDWFYVRTALFVSKWRRSSITQG
ncbi:receptor-like protein EIX1 [Salvia divinorum]|uniref:Receptor-like protein EIX1 n=1 Tax=Salvia divinorum TaxID=28513 RepID=A0ABD1HKP8_SALDI